MPEIWDLYFQDENEKTCALNLAIWVDANIWVCRMEDRENEIPNWELLSKIVQASIGDETDLNIVSPAPAIAEKHIESKENEILTPDDISRILRISLTSTYDLLQKGEIPARKVGGLWRSTRRQINGYLEREREMARKGSSQPTNLLRKKNFPIQKPSKVMGRRDKEGSESEETFIHR